jgi:transketolase
MRNTFIDELIKAARVRTDIVLIIGDLGYSLIEPFADEFPDRFFNAGIAEQNMMGMAAGMASEGMQVFTYSIGNFPTWRCAEQIRNDIDYHNLPVTNVMVGGGVTYGSLGYSHHAIQDYGLMRMLPNMKIASPGDPNETKRCFQYILSNKGPYYLRLRKSGEKTINFCKKSVQPGRLEYIGEKKNNYECGVVSTGGALEDVVKWMEREKIECNLMSVPLWGLSYKNKLNDELNKYKNIYVYEDHIQDCGFYSWIVENVEKKINIISKSISSEIIGLTATKETMQKISQL